MYSNAPKTAPKYWAKSGEPPAEWKDHWHENYHDPRVVPYRGKYAIAVTLPKELQKQTEFDKKLSAGTTDKKVAEERKWKIAAKIYTKFDEALCDIDPQIARDQAFRTKAVKLFAKHGIQSQKIKEELLGDFFEPGSSGTISCDILTHVPRGIAPYLTIHNKISPYFSVIY